MRGEGATLRSRKLLVRGSEYQQFRWPLLPASRRDTVDTAPDCALHGAIAGTTCSQDARERCETRSVTIPAAYEKGRTTEVVLDQGRLREDRRGFSDAVAFLVPLSDALATTAARRSESGEGRWQRSQTRAAIHSRTVVSQTLTSIPHQLAARPGQPAQNAQAAYGRM